MELEIATFALKLTNVNNDMVIVQSTLAHKTEVELQKKLIR